MLIGEAPGYNEDRTGRPFVGKAGQLLDKVIARTLTDELGILREHCYVTNLVKERPPENQDPTQADIDRDAHELVAEIIRVRPAIICSLGRISSQWLLNYKVSMEVVHGIAHECRVMPNAYIPVLVPAYHPAAALRSPDMFSALIYDFENLATIIKRCRQEGTGRVLEGRQDQHARTEYHELKNKDIATIAELTRSPNLGVDTEGSVEHPWSVQISSTPGQGYLIRPSSRKALMALRVGIRKFQPRIQLHAALHDLAVLRALGIDLPPDTYDDSMIMAYLLCLEPQGLKPLAYRWAGMEMSSYEEITRDADRDIVRLYLDTLRQRADFEADARKVDRRAAYIQEQIDKGKRTIRETLPKSREPKVPKWAQAVQRCLKNVGIEGRDARKQWKGQNPEVHEAVRVLRDPDLQHQLGDDPAEIREVTLNDVDPDTALKYACRDPDATTRIHPPLKQAIIARGLLPVYESMMGAVPLIDRMQTVGMLIDQDHFARLGPELEYLYAMKLLEIKACVGQDINPNSGDVVAALLFDKLKLPWKKLTKSKTRPSTEDKILEALVSFHPVVQMIIDGRELTKIKGTYVDKLHRFVRADGRLHPNLRNTRVVSGRLAASDPNVLAIPKHSALGKAVRTGFVAPPACLLGSWDLDQIEMRVMAHESQDPTLLDVFLTGRDVHADTAQLIFGVPPNQQDPDKHRYPAKAVNFGILMGLTGYGLMEQMHKNKQLQWTEDQCHDLIAEWYKSRPKCREFIEAKKAQARQCGYVTDFAGRRRYLAAVHDDNDAVRHEALRQAHATPIQAGAQEVMQLWEAAVYDEVLVPYWKAGRHVEPLLQIHDDLLLEHETELAQDLDVEMVAVIPQILTIPVGAKAHHGSNWAEV